MGISDNMQKFNPWTLVTFTRKLVNTIGLKFTLMLSSNYYITKGFNHFLTRGMMMPWFRSKGYQSQVWDLNNTIAIMPWSMKGFFGVISDCFALFGYSKTSYLIIFSVVATIAAVLLLVVPDSILFAYELTPGILFFFVHVQASPGDLYCEGKYVEKMKQYPELKASIVVYVWWCQMFGGLWPDMFLGAYAEYYNIKWLNTIVIILVAQMFPFLFYGCMVDDKVPAYWKNRFNTAKYKAEWKLMTLGVLMGCSAVGLALIGPLPYLYQMAAAVIISIIMCVLTWLWLPKVIAGGVIYLFFADVCNVGNAGTIDAWILSDEECVPGGPHFSITFVRSVAPVVARVFQIIGLWAFAFFVVKLEFRHMIWVTNLLTVLAGAAALLLYTRTNLSIGIPDQVFYIFTQPVLGTMFSMMNHMPITLLIAKLCPKDVEATVYAILAGFSNFGQQVAAYLGIGISDALGINSAECKFDNFFIFMLIVTFPPLIEIPLTFFLIPGGKKIEDDFLGEMTSNLKTSEVSPSYMKEVNVYE